MSARSSGRISVLTSPPSPVARSATVAVQPVNPAGGASPAPCTTPVTSHCAILRVSSSGSVPLCRWTAVAPAVMTPR